MTLVLEYPTWFIVLCIALGVGYAMLLYYKEHHLTETKRWLKTLLGILRGIVVTILAFLLLGPLLKTVFQEVEKPIIIVAADNSGSLVLSKDSIWIKNELRKRLEELGEELSSDFEVAPYSFGEKLQMDVIGSYSEKVTNLSDAFEELFTRFNHRNIGALILATDGIYNQGSSPLYAARNFNFPIYTIALGDTSRRKDARIAEVRHNKLAYLGNQFPVEIQLEATELIGRDLEFEIVKDGQVLHAAKIKSTSNAFSQNVLVNLEASKTGLQKFSVRLKAIDGEAIVINNLADVYIDVIDSRQKILILSAVAHPDVGAIREALASNDNYEVNTSLISDFDGKWEDNSLVILHQLPNGTEPFAELSYDMTVAGMPVLYMVGALTDMVAFNEMQKAYNVIDYRGNLNETNAEFNKNFTLFKLEDEHARKLERYPPMHVPFGKFKKGEAASAFLNQKIGFVGTDDPLIVFQKTTDQKIGVVTGEGLWRWRIVNYADDQNHDVFNGLISKVVQYLAAKEDKSYFRVYGKNKYAENEPLVFNAELYNKSYELVNDPDVSISIRNEDGQEYSYSFSKTEDGYRLNAGMLPVGEYNYMARATHNGEEYREEGVFSIAAIRLESASLMADHQLLYNLADKLEGKMVYPDAIQSLSAEIKAREEIKPRIYSKKNLAELISVEWILVFLLTLLSLEWFLRKRNGAY